MSDLLHNQQNEEYSPQEDEPASDFSAEIASPNPEQDRPTPPSGEIPLPDFDQDDQRPTLAKGSGLLSESSESTLEPEPKPTSELANPPAQGSYRVSSAASDWSDFTLPPLDDPVPPEAESASGWKTVWAVVREVGETIILTLIIFFLIQTVIRNFRVVGTSMVDNLHNGQYLIIDKLSYSPWITEYLNMGGPQRGDVIVFEPPNRPGEDYVKRIIGLPGETVEIVRGQVLINGEPLEETFQPRAGTYSMPPQVVPEGQVFVLGDNRNNSNDSHNWGALPLENIVGRAWISYWPPDQWGTIPRDTPTEQTTLKHFLQQLVPSANAGSE